MFNRRNLLTALLGSVTFWLGGRRSVATGLSPDLHSYCIDETGVRVQTADGVRCFPGFAIIKESERLLRDEAGHVMFGRKAGTINGFDFAAREWPAAIYCFREGGEVTHLYCFDDTKPTTVETLEASGHVTAHSAHAAAQSSALSADEIRSLRGKG